MADIVAKNPGEVEFHQAVREVVESVAPYVLENPQLIKMKVLERIAEHYVGINTGSERKYRIIKEASQKLNCPVAFDVLYYAQKTNNEDVIDEIGQKEGELIRQYRPLLNTQIPKAEDWRKWKVKPINAEEVLKLLLDE